MDYSLVVVYVHLCFLHRHRHPELVFLGNLTWTMDFASSLLLVFGLMICCCYLVKVLSVSSGLDLVKIGLADGVINLELYFGQKNPLFFQRNLH